MKLLSDWGITTNWWRGDRGEYWVVAQGILLLIFVLLPPNQLSSIDLDSSVWQYTSWILTAIFSILAIVFLGRWRSLFSERDAFAQANASRTRTVRESLSDLGQNLTPLPHPRDEGQLVKTGVYGLVRHPMYGGVIYLALAYASWQMSWLHLVGSFA